MKFLKCTFYALALAGFASCGASSEKNDNKTIIEQSSIADEDVSDKALKTSAL